MKSKTKNNYIDVWESILNTSKKFSPLEVFALIATKAYGQSLRQVGKILQTPPGEIKKIVKRLERAIRKDLKEQGANLKRLSNVHGVDHIVEITEDIGDSDDDYSV